MMRYLMPVILCFLCYVPQSGQAQSSNCKASTLDPGLVTMSQLTTRKPVPYTPLREADVMWQKRIWRRIDMRQKLNHPLYFPERPVGNRWSLFDVIRCAILRNGTITAYNPGTLGDDDQFTKRMTATEVQNLLRIVDTVTVTGLDGIEFRKPVFTDISSRDVRFYDVKEEWFFDKQRSVFDVRIIGICPMIAVKDEITGEFRGYKPLFWIYYPEARHVFANYKAYIPRNDISSWSYDDLFRKRYFASYIIKKSNVYDRFIAEHKRGRDALLESQSIKEELMNFEHDLWSY